MAFDFPNTPTIGQIYQGYTWDGEKWTLGSSPIPAPATAVPLVESGTGAVGGSLKYAKEDHVHPLAPAGTGAVRYDVAQGLTSAQQQQGRQNIYAAPFDALAYNGIQINGGIEVSQQYGFDNGPTVSTTQTYFADGWLAAKAGTMSGPVYAANGVFLPGFTKGIAVRIDTAEASLGSGDYLSVINRVEGYRWSRLAWGTANAQPVTIGFWTAHSRPGTYSGSIRNSDGTRACAFSYTQNAGVTGEYKTVTLPGCTDGAWNSGNGTGADIFFTMAAGTGFIAPATGVWYPAGFIAAPGQINGVAATTDFFRLGGVVILPGVEAPSAARSPLIMRPFDQEVVLCQRYWQKSYPYATLPGANIGAGNGGILFSHNTASGAQTFTLQSRLRAAGTFTAYDGVGTSGKVSYFSTAWFNGGVPTRGSGNETTVFLQTNVSGALQTSFDFTMDARL